MCLSFFDSRRGKQEPKPDFMMCSSRERATCRYKVERKRGSPARELLPLEKVEPTRTVSERDTNKSKTKEKQSWRNFCQHERDPCIQYIYTTHTFSSHKHTSRVSEKEANVNTLCVLHSQNLVRIARHLLGSKQTSPLIHPKPVPSTRATAAAAKLGGTFFLSLCVSILNYPYSS